MPNEETSHPVHDDNQYTAEYYAVGALKLLPAVTFGLRAAALAGLVLPAGAAAAGLSGVFDSPAAIAGPSDGITCCP